ncbi:uncharacterized protein [Spinacia oleracea]|uniref:Uncharacterized protein n=1 Tax=Spinacia oleracea TaxID=3562 RepID=A0ABM3QJS1_SPIOL|nr:uncharacterized protein LOC110783601 [Spinacia oleracea]
MIKYWISGGRSVLHVSKADYQNGAINMLRASSFSSASHNPKNIHSNKVDAPFATAETKVAPRTTSVEDPVEDPFDNYNKNNKDGSSRSTTEDAADYMADKAKKGSKGVVETALDVGEKLAEGVEQTFGTVKETTNKVKESVLGEYDEDGGYNYNRADNVDDNDDHGKVDKHVDDLRRKAGGYDLRRPH